MKKVSTRAGAQSRNISQQKLPFRSLARDRAEVLRFAQDDRLKLTP